MVANDNRNLRFVREFTTPLNELTLEEKKVVNKLVEAVRLLSPLYEKQVNSKTGKSIFYPSGVTKEKIEEAAREDSEILCPYTVVERKNGKLVTIPYHIKFKDDLLKISQLLKEAAEITSNKAFAKRLILQADALLDGSYGASDIYWLTMDPYKIQIVIGPLNRYDDKLFFRKTSYEGWVGILDLPSTKEALQFKDLFASAERRNKGWDMIDIWDKLQIRVDETLIYAGFGARSNFTAYNLPDDPVLIEKYGSEITFFGPALEMKFETRHLPIFQQLFHSEFQRLFSKDDLRKADLRNIIIHELGHPLLRYKHAPERLKELFPVFDEIAASIVGIKNAGTLVLKDFICQKELEAILIMFICWALDWSEEGANTLNVQPFVTGNAIALNYFFESGALKESGGISWPNFTKMFLALNELSSIIERILASGTYEEAKDFIGKYGSTKIFNQFNIRLAKFYKSSQVRQ